MSAAAVSSAAESTVRPGPPLEAKASNGKSTTLPANGAAPAANGNGSDPADLRLVCAQLTREVQRLTRTVEHLTEAAARPLRDEVMREVDARFAWLTNELSDRLVVLGNEIVAVKRHLESLPDASPE